LLKRAGPTSAIATPPGNPTGLADLAFRQRGLLMAATRVLTALSWIGPFSFGKLVIAVRYRDVMDVLSRDVEFLIRPVHGPAFEEIDFDFVLGMDRTAEMARERHALYAALAAVDTAPIRAAAETWIAEKLKRSATQIDVVEDYARPLAAATARALFGIAPADETQFVDAVRAIHGYCFLNLSDDAAVKQRALTAAALLSGWFLDEIRRRRTSGELGADMMGQLLGAGACDDLTRRTLGGMLVGSIDTTATAVAKIITVLMDKPAWLERASRDAQHPERLWGWCQEALRRWPQTPILVRMTAEDPKLAGVKAAATPVKLAGVTVHAGATVMMATQAAMFDATAIPYPYELRPDRPASAYLHLGGGLHPCAGRLINAWQIPALVGGLLRRGPVRLEPMEWAGPFPAHLIAHLRGGDAT